MLRILTDRGSENHDDELYLAINDIEQTKMKVKHPQCFHKTILAVDKHRWKNCLMGNAFAKELKAKYLA